MSYFSMKCPYCDKKIRMEVGVVAHTLCVSDKIAKVMIETFIKQEKERGIENFTDCDLAEKLHLPLEQIWKITNKLCQKKESETK